jgi:hypothetical protein
MVRGHGRHAELLHGVGHFLEKNVIQWVFEF